jgi:hypothetical protein
MGRLLPVMRTLPIVLVFTCASVSYAAGPGGSGDESGDGNIDVYLALGAAAIIGAILVFDVFSGPEGGSLVAEEVVEPAPPIEDTGVDWESVTPEEPDIPVVAVSIFPSPSGESDTASLFLSYLSAAGGESMEVYPEPLALGTGSPSEESALAGEFFGAGYFLVSSETGSGIDLNLYSGTEGPLWTYTIGGSDSLLLKQAAENLAGFVSDRQCN